MAVYCNEHTKTTIYKLGYAKIKCAGITLTILQGKCSRSMWPVAGFTVVDV